MDEESNTASSGSIPFFVYNALKELINLRSNLTEIDILDNIIKNINVSVSSDIHDFVEKFKEFINSVKISIINIDQSFNKNYKKFKKHREVDSDNLNGTQKSLNNSSILTDTDNSDNNASLLDRTKKLSKLKLSKSKEKSNASSTVGKKQSQFHKKRNKNYRKVLESTSDSDDSNKSNKSNSDLKDSNTSLDHSPKYSNEIKLDSTKNIKDNERNSKNSPELIAEGLEKLDSDASLSDCQTNKETRISDVQKKQTKQSKKKIEKESVSKSTSDSDSSKEYSERIIKKYSSKLTVDLDNDNAGTNTNLDNCLKSCEVNLNISNVLTKDNVNSNSINDSDLIEKDIKNHEKSSETENDIKSNADKFEKTKNKNCSSAISYSSDSDSYIDHEAIIEKPVQTCAKNKEKSKRNKNKKIQSKVNEIEEEKNDKCHKKDNKKSEDVISDEEKLKDKNENSFNELNNSLENDNETKEDNLENKEEDVISSSALNMDNNDNNSNKNINNSEIINDNTDKLESKNSSEDEHIDKSSSELTHITEELDNKKPNVGFIKCVDITKLLDPSVINIQNETSDKKCDDSIVVLSSSDSEIVLIPQKKKSLKKNKSKTETKPKINEPDDSSDNEKSKINRKRVEFNSEIVKNKFEQLRTLRKSRIKHKRIIESSNSENESSSDISGISTNKNNKTVKKKSVINDLNYDHANDVKFKMKCCVSLPRVPVEKLKEYYLQHQEDLETKSLTNMKTLKKRTRQQKSSPSSSDNDSTVKKRGKLQISKKDHNDEGQSDISNNSDINDQLSDVPKIGANNGKNDQPPIPEDLLASDGNSDKKSDSSDENNENKKTNKNKPEKEKKNDENKDKSSKDVKKNEENEKDQCRNNSLLRGKLSASDSEDDLIRFRNKLDKIGNDIRSGTEEEPVVLKKSKTKKQMKRIARRLGSDVSSESEDKENSNKSDSNEEDKNEDSSDSDSKTQKKKAVRRRIKRIKDSDESSDGEDAENKKKKNEEEDKNTRKKIRNVWNKDSLADSTKQAAKEEEERKRRISERQKLYNEICVENLDANAKVDKVVLDFNEETKEELLSVHPDLVAKLKPHQAKGVQFMWTACFESIERTQNTEGSGCILAHCMGLGKTLQVITLIHTLLSNSEKTKVKTILVVCPLSTVLNWVNEFKKWLDDLDGDQVNVFDLVSHKQNYERLYHMQDWMKFGGVLIMGYDMFRNLSNPKGKRMPKKLANGFNKVLIEQGPDLVICDEGHLLKNEKTGISIAMNKLRTLRRIVLTGTPLQNNLKEYFCMVQFVKPNLLGTYKEYLNRFVNPITNGQYTDSTPHDIYIMRKRAHVLHKMLDAVVERRDYNVLAPFLPPKHEFVLFVTLTNVQIELYREYLTKFSQNKNVKGTSYLFQDFQELQRICIHPRVLLDKSNQDKLRKDNEEEEEDSEGSLKDFIDDDSEKSTTDNNSTSESENEPQTKATTRRTRANPGKIEDEPEPEPEVKKGEWWSKFCQGDELNNICHSSKIKLLFEILHQCELIGDKVLVFSQSLYSLNLIEYFLACVDEATQNGDAKSLALVGGYTGSWALGLDYFRMDGSTSCDNRSTWCKTFNNEANTRARLFLISTRAGGLGINLVAANRVIIFDVSWNPSYDVQSIYRVYRFGQTKPSYIYRFVTLGTMENKIYERQVTKQAISKRVIDEQQIDRHYNQNDLAELYAFNPIPDEERPTPLVPKDRLFADLLQTHEKHIFKYHEHNSLLENKTDEGLNEEERRAAWEEFENEKKAPKFNLMQTMVRNGMYETLRILVQQDNSAWTPAQVNSILPTIVQRISEQVARGDYSMYRRVEEKHEMRVMEQRRMQMIYQQFLQQFGNATGGNPMAPANVNKIAQLFSAFNQQQAEQQQQIQPQIPSSSSAVTFAQSVAPPDMSIAAVPKPHPAVPDVVELND